MRFVSFEFFRIMNTGLDMFWLFWFSDGFWFIFRLFFVYLVSIFGIWFVFEFASGGVRVFELF